jgi:type II secretory ATPase GspE/PulE/Tfp pilus assembly ATPase PilB-like protein
MSVKLDQWTMKVNRNSCFRGDRSLRSWKAAGRLNGNVIRRQLSWLTIKSSSVSISSPGRVPMNYPSAAAEAATISEQLRQLDPSNAEYATKFVDQLLAAARENSASDVHLHPTQDGLDVRWRLDGVLQPVGCFPRGEAADIVNRLKVLAELLTYRNDRPQEGRIRHQQPGHVEVRVSSFPTLHGERAVIRMFAALGDYLYVDNLGLPDETTERLRLLLSETAGAIVVSGPAGSGKTTTAYACLRELVREANQGRSIVSLEDPIEVAVDGVSQSQVNAASDFDLATGLRSLMRQDPEVILVGEIRDSETAEATFQASLTGHLVVSTFHAASASGAISRLSDMGIEPYLLRSGILGILCQRLVRRLCECKQPMANLTDLGLRVTKAWKAVGCSKCLGSGYRGRMVLAEILESSNTELGRAILSRDDSRQLELLAIQAGMVPIRQRAFEAVESGQTSPQEVRRVLGFSWS